MSDKYICNDDGVLEELRAARNMTDEEFKEYIEDLKEAEEKKLKELE